MRPFIKLITVAILATALIGCADQQMYHWGHYEKSVYRMYHSKDFSPSQEIVILKKDIEQARKKNKLMGPGVQAHMGYLFTLEGDTVAATEAFNTEIEAFPESKVMIERILRKMP